MSPDRLVAILPGVEEGSTLVARTSTQEVWGFRSTWTKLSFVRASTGCESHICFGKRFHKGKVFSLTE